MISQREIWLVPFPFSDQSGKKVRPVVVVSHNAFNEESEDAIVIGITSQLSKGKYTIPVLMNDVEGGKLLHSCYIKAENILKIDQRLAQKKIGILNATKFSQTIQTVESIIHE